QLFHEILGLAVEGEHLELALPSVANPLEERDLGDWHVQNRSLKRWKTYERLATVGAQHVGEHLEFQARRVSHRADTVSLQPHDHEFLDEGLIDVALAGDSAVVEARADDTRVAGLHQDIHVDGASAQTPHVELIQATLQGADQ